jgi:integrase
MKGTVRRLPSGVWIADVTVNGERRTAKRHTKAEAMEARRGLNQQLTRSQARAGQPGGITMADARALSLRIRWAGRAGERTAAIYSLAAVNHFGAETQLETIGAPQVEQWRQALLRQGNRPGTVNAKTSALRAMFADAVLHGHLAAVPSLPRQIRNQNTRDRVFSEAEVRGFCEWFVGRGEPAAADLFVFLLESCCRWSESEQLKGSDVDLERARVSFWRTKNGRPRSVPLTRRAVDALAPHLPSVPGHRIWPYRYSQFRHLFDQAKAAMGITDPALTIHSTRHTCASKLASRGISLQQVMVFGGWTSLQSVTRYLHLHTDALAPCVQALEAM